MKTHTTLKSADEHLHRMMQKTKCFRGNIWKCSPPDAEPYFYFTLTFGGMGAVMGTTFTSNEEDHTVVANINWAQGQGE